MKILIIAAAVLLSGCFGDSRIYKLEVHDMFTGVLLYHEYPLSLKACRYLTNGFRQVGRTVACVVLEEET